MCQCAFSVVKMSFNRPKSKQNLTLLAIDNRNFYNRKVKTFILHCLNIDNRSSTISIDKLYYQWLTMKDSLCKGYLWHCDLFGVLNTRSGIATLVKAFSGHL